MKRQSRWLAAPAFRVCLALGMAAASIANAGAATLEDVKSRGVLRCAVNGQLPGLSYKDSSGQWSGMDVDFCRAVAAATLGSADKVELVPVDAASRFDILREGEVDLLSRNSTWTLSRDLDFDIAFVGVLYFDSQGFIVRRETSTLMARELSAKPICAIADTTAVENVRAWFDRNRMQLVLKEYPDAKSAAKAYADGTCYALTADLSQLYAIRTELGSEAAHRILPDRISKEPLAPAVRRDDDRWRDIVRWTLFTLIDAEEAGIGTKNVDETRARASTPEVRLLLDTEGQTGRLLGLDKGWSSRVVQQVGNYGEIFDRNLGAGSKLKIERGLNALWRDGGILYAPPAR